MAKGIGMVLERDEGEQEIESSFDLNNVRLEEYKALRAEILERLRNQQLIVVANVALTTGGVAAVTAFSGLSPRDQVTAGLIIPFLSLLLLMRYLDSEALTAVLGGYLNNELRTQFPGDAEGRRNFLCWEEYRYAELQLSDRKIQVLGALYAAAAGLPAIVLLTGTIVSLIVNQSFRHLFAGGQWLMLALDLAFAAGALFYSHWVSTLYQRIVPAEPGPSGQKAEPKQGI